MGHRKDRKRQDSVGPWHGEHGPGAMRAHRERKRAEAEARNARTSPERRRKNRRAAQQQPSGKISRQKRAKIAAAKRAEERWREANAK